MLEAGVLAEGEPIELLEGWLAEKMTRGPKHDEALNRLLRALMFSLPPGWIVRAQSAITLGHSEPEPDLAVARDRAGGYGGGHPSAADCALVIEISDASLERDRDWKARIYASGPIPEYWIVNVRDRAVTVLREPDPASAEPSYRVRREHRAGEPIRLELDGREGAIIDPGAILPE